MAAPTRRRQGWRKRLGALARFAGALALVGGIYTAFAPGIYADEADDNFAELAAEGEELFLKNCSTCHGPNADGVDGRGPSLIGVGGASVEFQVNTGRMPMAQQEAQAPPKEPKFTPEEAEMLAAYVQQLGGGPEAVSQEYVDSLVDDVEAAEGNELYRVNCSSCHGFSGGGGALASGKYAPALDGVGSKEMYEAMLTGPQNMPVFGDNQLTPEEKAEIIAYVQYITEDKDPGGMFTLGRFGPSTEGLTIFLVGITTLALATLWIAGKS